MAKKHIVSVTADQAAASLAEPPEDQGKPVRYKPKRASAGPCPKVESHTNTRIYRTDGATRYCVCDDCGTNWKQSGVPSDALDEFALRLAESFDQAPRVEDDGQQLVVFEDAALKDIAAQLRQLAGA